MSVLPKESIYRGYKITNSGIVVRIWKDGTMLHYGEMSEEDAHAWIDKDIKLFKPGVARLAPLSDAIKNFRK